MSKDTASGPAFDDYRPPAAEFIADCVHCGFCLPTCPTYVLWGEEADSPRGRIYLMRIGLEGEPLRESMVANFDACLGCLACVTACPSGVRYDRLIEAARAQIERRYRRPLVDRLVRGAIFAVFPHPRRLRLLRAPLTVYQRLGLQHIIRRSGLLQRFAALAAVESLAPQVRPAPPLPARIAARGKRRAVVGMLTGCVQQVFLPRVNAATARVLAMEGCDVIIPRGQGCCGALSVHNGRTAEAAKYARRIVDTFEAAGVDYVAVNAAGCGSAMKQYVDLLSDDPRYAKRAERFAARVRDACELLAELGPLAQRHPLPVTVAYHDACHLAHAQRIWAEPRELLRGIPSLTLHEVGDAAMCCGSAGIYSVAFPRTAAELGDRKARAVRDTGAELVATANPGCLLQISAALHRQGARLPLAHPIEVLDASLHGRTVAQAVRELALAPR